MKSSVILLSILLPFLSPAFAQEKATVLQVDLLIDGTGREPIKDAVIVIEGQRIKRPGARERLPFRPARG